jgi:hypothetical protein
VGIEPIIGRDDLEGPFDGFSIGVGLESSTRSGKLRLVEDDMFMA